MFKDWLENEPKVTLVCAVTSAIALVLSITGALKNILPFDIAWVAILLCGIPILVGARPPEPRHRRAVAQLRICIRRRERGTSSAAEGRINAQKRNKPPAGFLNTCRGFVYSVF